MQKKYLGSLVVFLSTSLCLHSATWNGNNGSSWNDGNNWDTTMVPPPGDTLVFPQGISGSYTSTNDISNPFQVGGMQFTQSGGSSYNITGSDVEWNAGTSFTTDSGTGSVFISTNFILDGNLDVTLNSSNQVVFNGVISGGGTLTMQSSSAQLELYGANTYSGGTTINSGAQLIVRSGGNLGTGPLSVTGNLFLESGTVTSGPLSGSSGSITLGGALLTVNMTGANNTFSGAIIDSGSGRFEITGSGTLHLSGSTTYNQTYVTSGATWICDSYGQSGTFHISDATWQFQTGVGISTEVMISGTAIFDTGSNGISIGNILQENQSNPPPVTTAGTLTKTGSGSLALVGTTYTYSGGNHVLQGTVTIGNFDPGSGPMTIENGGNFDATNRGGTLSVGDLNIASGGTLTLGTNSVQTTLTGSASIFGNLSAGGSGSLTLAGSGMLTISSPGVAQIGSANVNTGTTLAYDMDSSINTTGVLLSGGTVDLLAGNTFTSALGVNGSGSINTGSTVSAIYTGLIYNASFPASITKTGSGTLNLNSTSPPNTFLNITAQEGELQANQDGDLGVGNVTFAGGTLLLHGMGSSFSNTATLSSAGTIIINPSDSSTWGGVISGGSDFTKAGDGTLTLTAANTYTGTTMINGGTLALSGSGNLTSTGSVSLNSSGVVFDISGASSIITIGDLSGAAGSTVSFGGSGGTLTFGTNNPIASTFDGVFSGSGNLVKQGSSVFIVSGTSTQTGTVTITAGTFRASAASAFSPNSLFSVDAGAVLDLNGNNNTIGNLSGVGGAGGTVTLGSGTLTLGGDGSSTTFEGVISGTGGLTKEGTGTFTLTDANNSYTGGSIINAGTFALSGSGALASTGTVNVNASGAIFNISGVTTGATIGDLRGVAGSSVVLAGKALTFGTVTTPITFAGVISGSGGSLTKQGSGTVIFTGSNSYTGGTTINAGTLALSGSGALASTGTVNVNASGAVFDISGVTTGATIGDLRGVAGSSVVLAGKALTFGTATTPITFAGVISGSGGSLTKQGSGTVIFTGSNSYTGGTTINAGTLALSGSGALASTGTVNVNASGAVFDISGVTTGATIGDLRGVAGSSVVLTGKALTFGTATTPITFAGVLSGVAGSLTKQGSGTVIFTGSNTYSGTTTINVGTIQAGAVNTFSPSSAVVLANTSGVLLNLNGNSNIIGNLSGGGGTGGNVSLGSATLTLGNAAPTSYDGVISGSGGLIKQGSATQTLTRANTYTGQTTINAGTLALSGSGALASTGTVSVNASGAVFNISGVSGTTIGDLFGVAGSSVNLGSGTLAFGTSNGTTFAGVISGSGGNLFKQGSGTIVLSGSNTYTGTTTINAGAIQAGAVNTFSPSSAVTLANTSGVLLNLANNSNIIGNLSGGGGTGGNVTLGSGTLTVGNATTPSPYDGVISGTGGLVKQGIGTLTLRGVNTYTGQTTINAGTLALSVAGALASTGTVNVAASGAIFDISGVTSGATIGDLTGAAGSSVVLTGKTLTLGGTGNSTTFAGVISGSGGNLVKQGTGTFTVSGSNTYSGTTTVSAGTLRAAAVNTFSPSSAITLANTSGVLLDLNDLSNVIANLSGGGGTGGNVSLGSGILTLGNSSSTSFGGVISGTSGTGGITKQGAGTFTLTGTGNTYSGTTTINAGVIQANAASTLPASSPFVLANVAGAALDLNNFSNTIANLSGGGALGGNVTLVSAALTVGNASSTTYDGVISGVGGSLTKQGIGTLELTRANTYPGGTTINGGTLALSSSGALSSTGTVNVNASGASFDINGLGGSGTTIGNLIGAAGSSVNLGAKTLTFGTGSNTTFLGVISGSGGSLVKQGSGIFTVSGSNTYSGTTTINVGSFQAGAANTFSASSPVTLANTAGAVLDLNGNNNTIANLSGGGITGGNVTLGTATLTLGNNSPASYDGVISGSGGLIKQGSSTQTLTRANTYTGQTTINAGTLALSVAGALASTGTVSLPIAGAAFDISGVTASSTIGTLSGIAGTTVNLGAKALTVGTAVSSTYSGNIGGAGGSFTKVGSGTLVLRGTNTYSGGTTVSAGALQGDTNSLQGNILNNTTVDFNQSTNGTYTGQLSGTGSFIKSDTGVLSITGTSTQANTLLNGGGLMVNGLLTSPVLVAPGATLGGTGTITGSVGNSGTVAPGNSIGTLNIVGPYTQLTGSSLEIEFNTTQTDLLNITGAATIQSGTTLALFPTPGMYPGTPIIFLQAAGGVSGTFSTVTNSLPLLQFTVTYLANAVELTFGGTNPIVNFVSTGNGLGVARCLDSFSPPAGSDLEEVFIDLQMMTAEQINQSINSMQPSLFKGMILSQENNNIRVMQAINEYLYDRCDISSQKQTGAKEPKRRWNLFSRQTETESAIAEERNRWNVWADFFGDALRQRGNSTENGFKTNSGGVVNGFDYQLAKNYSLGFTSAYTYSKVNWSDSQGSGHINSAYVGLYNSFFNRFFFANASVVGTFDWYHASRKIDLVTHSRHAKHKNYGNSVTGHLDTGLSLAYKKFSFNPFIGGYYTYLHEKGYKEHGAQSLDLKVSSSSYKVARGEAGANFYGYFCTDHGQWVPTVGVSWIREVRFGGQSYHAAFFHDGAGSCGFSVKGLKPNHTLISPKAGIKATFYDDFLQISLNYVGEFGHKYKDNNGHLKFDFNF